MINRQLEMIYILMNKGMATAEELAAHFEVSARTIYRDVESLSMAGIPIYAGRGKGGGIRLMEQFVLNKLLLSEEEQRRILAALASLRETGASGEEKVLKKLETFFRTEPMDWVAIDFSDWSGRRGELFGQIKEAILGRHVMEFDYYGRYGDMTHRQVEPVQLLFKEYTWYVRAWCRKRGAMRLFKVLRMKRVEILDEVFAAGVRHREGQGAEAPETQAASGEPGTVSGDPGVVCSKPGMVSCESETVPQTRKTACGKGEMASAILEAVSRESETVVTASRSVANETKGSEAAANTTEVEKLHKEKSYKNDGSVICEVIFRIDKREAYRIYDRFDENEITVLPQGDFEIRMCCPIDDWAYGLILSFGPSARVLEPEWVRKEIRERIRRMAQMYERNGTEFTRGLQDEKQGEK